MAEQTLTKATAVPTRESKRLNLKMPGENGLIDFKVPAGQLASSNKEFFKSFGRMLLSTRSSGKWNNQYEPGLLQKVISDNQVTCKELHDACYKAYSDAYTPQSGIEWRRLWKHIEESRLGCGGGRYTYQKTRGVLRREQRPTGHIERG